jgi:hypothetical protein
MVYEHLQSIRKYIYKPVPIIHSKTLCLTMQNENLYTPWCI